MADHSRNVEAERAVLGGMIVDSNFRKGARSLDALAFSLPAHRIIFQQLLALSSAGHAINLTSVEDSLARDGSLETVGGVAYLASLLVNCSRRVAFRCLCPDNLRKGNT